MKLINCSFWAWLSLINSSTAAESSQQQQQQQNERQLPKHDEVDSRGAGNNNGGIETRIINGDEAERGRYNYFVRLYGSSQCGGSLVAPDLALTNAHCS